MTKEHIVKRRDLLQAEFDRLRSHLESLHGAIQDCNYWLAELEKPVEPIAEKVA